MLEQKLAQHRIELICLGGFMRLFTAEFVRRWYGRMLNIHPSLLPSFPGLDPHGQALKAGVKISGATVHFVIPETDAGPIVMQGAVPVRDDDTAEALSARILAVEHRIYPEALRLLASGRLRLEGDLCRIEGGADGGVPDLATREMTLSKRTGPKRKSPGRGRGDHHEPKADRDSQLGDLEVFRGLFAAIFDKVVFNRLVFIEGREPGTLDSGDMDEHVPDRRPEA